jgi:hypothetical protein
MNLFLQVKCGKIIKQNYKANAGSLCHREAIGLFILKVAKQHLPLKASHSG